MARYEAVWSQMDTARGRVDSKGQDMMQCGVKRARNEAVWSQRDTMKQNGAIIVRHEAVWIQKGKI